MQTFKTGVVIVLLGIVCWGAFVALNAPEADIPEELRQWANSADELNELDELETPDGLFEGAAVDPSDALPGLSVPQLGSNETDAASVDPLIDVGDFPAARQVPSLEVPNLAAESDSITEQLPPLPAIPPVSMEQPASDRKIKALPVGDARPAAEPEWPAVGLPPAEGTQNPVATESTDQQQLPTLPFAIARDQAIEMANNKGKLKQALELLSQYYYSPELGSEQHGDLTDILDALAREVIYSNKHMLEMPYTVVSQDTVDSVAASYGVTPELLGAVNGLGDAKALVAGTQLKVIPGPFQAKVSLSRSELTLFLGKMYAGRFPVSFGTEHPAKLGNFEIVDRERQRTYHGAGGNLVKADDPSNPYGGFWLSLGQNLSIHGSPMSPSENLSDAGCISLAPGDAADVYKILAKGCSVEIVR